MVNQDGIRFNSIDEDNTKGCDPIVKYGGFIRERRNIRELLPQLSTIPICDFGEFFHSAGVVKVEVS